MRSQMADTSHPVDRIIKHRGVAVPTFLYGFKKIVFDTL